MTCRQKAASFFSVLINASCRSSASSDLSKSLRTALPGAGRPCGPYLRAKRASASVRASEPAVVTRGDSNPFGVCVQHREQARAGRRARLQIEAGECEGPRRRGCATNVLEEFPHLGTVPPCRWESLSNDAEWFLTLSNRLPAASQIVKGSLEHQNVEVHLLMEELDQARLGQQARPVAVAALAEHHDARIAEDLLQRLQVIEPLVGRIDRPNAHRMLFEPPYSDVRGKIDRTLGVHQPDQHKTNDKRAHHSR